jgi:chromosome partitioning protein
MELPPVARDLRSPELIEAGMVYVDPDPEIGSPPHAVVEQPAARPGPEGDPGDPPAAPPVDGAQGSTAGDGSAPGIGGAEVGGSPGADVPAEAAGGAGAEEAAGPQKGAGAGPAGEPGSEPGTDAASAPGTLAEAEGGTAAAGSPTTADRGDGSDGPEIRNRTDAEELGMHADDALRSGLLEAGRHPIASEATGSRGAGEVSRASTPGEGPWNEPALPMAWPAGMTPPDRGERGGLLHEDPDAGDLVLEPDPTWPRLFGQSSQPRGLDGPAEAADGVQATASVDQVGGERNTDKPSDLPAVQQVGTVHAAQADHPPSGQRHEGGATTGSPDARQLSTEPASGHPAADATPSDQRPPVVDLTSQKPSVTPGSGEPPEPSEGTAPQPEAMTGARNEGGIDAASHASISTVVQQAKTEEGEVDLRETPANPRSIDVSRETSTGGGGGMDPGVENENLEDEAAVAVREAVSRAAAEAGVDVSRETEQSAANFSIDELDDEPSIDRESAARTARVTFRIDRDALNGDRRVMAVANQKGGVGKSTTAVNIGAYLALAGARVLVVDLDPQGNASTGLGLEHREIEPSIYDVLTGEASPAAAIRPTGVANLHVLPSTIDLAGAEVELVSAMSRETRLRRALESVDHTYDSILIDCPPSLGLLTVNALAAADELLIPIQCEYYALEGLGQLLRNVELVRANLNPDLRIGGIVLTMYDGRTRLALQVVDEVRKHFTDVVYQTVVPRSVRLSEAPGYGLPIALYDPLSRGGIAYRDLTFELAERSGLLAPTGEGAS